MSTFLILYISIYLLMHAYAFYHAWRSLQYGRITIFCTALFSMLMVLSPIIVRVAERNGFENGPGALAYICFTWMGILFLFVAVAWFYDVFALGNRFLQMLMKKNVGITPLYRRRRFLVQLVFVAGMYCYGVYEANQIRTVNITIRSPKISQATGTFRVVQISDVHLGLIVKEKKLEKILAVVAEAKPDLVVSTGDLVDGQLNDLSEVAKMLQQVDPPFGKLAVTGNHEFYAGLQDSLEFTDTSGFLLLRNKAINVNGIMFAGVDDAVSKRFDGQPEIKEVDLLKKQRPGVFTVLLKHRPVIEPDSVGLFDIQLSGHTHKGQIFPFNVFTWLSFRYPNGINMLEYGYIYISNGSGTWGPPIRFLSPPEVTVIDFVHGG